MAGGFKLTIEGFDKLQDKLDPERLADGIEMVLDEFAETTVREAKIRAPKDNAGGAGIAGRINYDVGALSRQINVNVFYAAYVEFGTGPYAAEYLQKLGKEWQEYARQFYVNGEGRTPAQPFLYPAFEIARRQLIIDLKQLLND